MNGGSYERQGDRYAWVGRTPPPRAEPHLRCGMDVQIRGHAGHWMIVGFDGPLVVCAGVDVPGDLVTVKPRDTRPLWLPGVNRAEAA